MLAAVLATATGLLPTPLHRYAANARSSAPMASSSDYDVRLDEVAERSSRLIAAKEEAGLSFDELATKLGLTNTYTAQLFLGQAQLKANTAPKLKKALPSVSDDDVQAMMAHFPMRGFDERILQEPNVYRTYEAVTHYGEAIKRIINEECGDGIMSAIDFYCAHPRLHCSRPQPSPALPRLRHQPLVGAPAVTPAIPRPRRRCRDDNRQGGREARRHHIQRQVPALHRAAGRRQHGFESEGLRARGRAMCLSNRALEADRLWSRPAAHGTVRILEQAGRAAVGTGALGVGRARHRRRSRVFLGYTWTFAGIPGFYLQVAHALVFEYIIHIHEYRQT